MKKILLLCALIANALTVLAGGEFTIASLFLNGEIAAMDNIVDTLNTVEGVTATGTITYNESTKTLTLNQSSIIISDSKNILRTNSWAEDVTIELIGENTFQNTSDTYEIAFRLIGGATNSVTITGEGSLSISTKKWYPISLESGSLTIRNTTVIACSEDSRYGIQTEVRGHGDLYIENANVEAAGIRNLASITLTDCYIKQPIDAEVVYDESECEIDKKGSTENIIIVPGKKPEGTALENISTTPSPTKCMKNGQIVITTNEKIYNTAGQEIK